MEVNLAKAEGHSLEATHVRSELSSLWKRYGFKIPLHIKIVAVNSASDPAFVEICGQANDP